ncbi:DUF2514 family protein, partial [Salmonella enterica]|uniref:DUF2514 family protein n=1 Tax=Salmonella enterica TaxID=28901 RepID=UPI00398C7EC4
RHGKHQTREVISEQGRGTAMDGAVKASQGRATKPAGTAAGLSATVSQLRTGAKKIATRVDAAKNTANLAAADRSKTTNADPIMLANMLGDLADAANHSACTADERNRAGMMYGRTFDSEKRSSN